MKHEKQLLEAHIACFIGAWMLNEKRSLFDDQSRSTINSLLH